MKKSIAFLLCVLLLALVLTACGNDTNTDKNATDSQDNGIVNDVGDGAKDVIDGAAEGADDVIDGGKNVVHDAADAVRDAVDGVGDAAKDIVDGADNAANGRTAANRGK